MFGSTHELYYQKTNRQFRCPFFFFFNPLLQQNLMMTDDSRELFVVGKYDHNLEPITCRPLSYVERTSPHNYTDALGLFLPLCTYFLLMEVQLEVDRFRFTTSQRYVLCFILISGMFYISAFSINIFFSPVSSILLLSNL